MSISYKLPKKGKTLYGLATICSFMPEYNDYCNENGLIKTHLNKNFLLLITCGLTGPVLPM